MNRGAVRLVILTVVIVFATMAVAWWTVPLIGGVFGLVAARRGIPYPVLTPFAAGLLGWAALVLVAVFRGGAGRAAELTGGILGVPSWALFVVTPVYGALLAGAAALVAGSVLSGVRGA